jgi:hypothetical protein
MGCWVGISVRGYGGHATSRDCFFVPSRVMLGRDACEGIRVEHTTPVGLLWSAEWSRVGHRHVGDVVCSVFLSGSPFPSFGLVRFSITRSTKICCILCNFRQTQHTAVNNNRHVCIFAHEATICNVGKHLNKPFI